MKYRLHIQDPLTCETTQIIVFSPVEEGTIIGWGADCREQDGLRKWKVFGCVADPYVY